MAGAASPMLEPRISLVTFAVADVDASTQFYAGLGWTPGFRNEEVAFFQLGGLVLGLWERAQMAQHLGIPESDLGPGGMEVAHNVHRREDVDAALATAELAGGRILRPAADAEWGGRSGHFSDLDGHRWEVAWNPAWTLTDDGRTLLDATAGAPPHHG